jgi:hypothetical protein
VAAALAQLAARVAPRAVRLLDLRPRLEAEGALLDANFPDGVHTSAASAVVLAAAVAPTVHAVSQQGSTTGQPTWERGGSSRAAGTASSTARAG